MVNEWFSKVNIDGGFIDKLSPSQLGKKIKINLGNPIDIKNTDIVICSTNTLKSKFDREQFYQMYNHFGNLVITDLGVFKSDSVGFVLKAIEEIVKSHKVIIFDAPLELTQQMFKNIFTDSHKNNIIVSESNQLDTHEFPNYDLLGYQKHKCSPISLQYLKTERFNSISLGEYRDDYKKVEPILRDTQVLSFHPNSTQFNKEKGIQIGFNIEESCQIMKYAGLSENIRLISFIQSPADSNYAVADMCWYYLEGANVKLREDPSTKTGFQEYVVSSKEQEYDFSFIKSNSTNRWWLKTIHSDTDYINYLACSEEEYDEVCKDNVPQRFLKYLSKF